MSDLWWTAFLLGLATSVHCLGMCGPLAVALPGGGPGGGRGRYLAGRVLYNLGRIVTYATLGAIFGVIGETMALAGLQRFMTIATGVLILAGVLFASRLHGLATRIPATAVLRLKARLGLLLRQPDLISLSLIGLLNGLLPCGPVYVALGGAALTVSAQEGAIYMACFGLGTFPLMLATSLAGRVAFQAIRRRFRLLIPIVLCLLGLLFILRGMNLGIRFISPDLTQPPGEMGCCATEAPEASDKE